MSELVLVGAGPVGLAAARAAVEDGAATRVSAVVDPVTERREAAAEELDAKPCERLDDVPDGRPDDWAVACFSSRAEVVAPVLEELVLRGYNAVTTCEELADPGGPARAQLSLTALQEGRAIVVTGANPGFVMDRLPLVLARGARQVTAVTVTRKLDTRTRRGPLVDKTGRGLTPTEFAAGVEEGRLGHVGLETSARLLADGLGWPIHGTRTTIEPVLDATGVVQGLHQIATLDGAAGTRILLDLVMSWGAEDPHDAIVVEGVPRLRVRLDGGYHGDEGTTARVVAAISAGARLSPGLYLPSDVPVSV